MDGQWILTNIKSETCTLTVSRGPYKWGKSKFVWGNLLWNTCTGCPSLIRTLPSKVTPLIRSNLGCTEMVNIAK
jgi:hypothetical protein